MAMAFECDRCKTLFPASHIPDIRIVKYTPSQGGMTYDLCDKCAAEVTLFIESPPSLDGDASCQV